MMEKSRASTSRLSKRWGEVKAERLTWPRPPRQGVGDALSSTNPAHPLTDEHDYSNTKQRLRMLQRVRLLMREGDYLLHERLPEHTLALQSMSKHWHMTHLQLTITYLCLPVTAQPIKMKSPPEN